MANNEICLSWEVPLCVCLCVWLCYCKMTGGCCWRWHSQDAHIACEIKASVILTVLLMVQLKETRISQHVFPLSGRVGASEWGCQGIAWYRCQQMWIQQEKGGVPFLAFHSSGAGLIKQWLPCFNGLSDSNVDYFSSKIPVYCLCILCSYYMLVFAWK